ncbi:MAG: undecaprenyldiphospho-muramoylpentapeptide beta-N-acetylglucosaminyltransferase [bacterium]
MRILLTGGGSGGHIMPILAVVKSIKQQTREEAEFLFVGSVNKETRGILEAEGIRVKNVFCGKMRRYFSLQNFLDLFKIPLGLIQAFWVVFFYMPDVVFCKGGYASMPGAVAAWFFRLPIIIHESDTIPGLTNRIIGKLARVVIISFEKPLEYFPKEKTVLLGNPVRKDLLQGNPGVILGKLFSATSRKPLILILGGSQGAVSLNNVVLETLPRLLKEASVIHQCGKLDFENVVATAKQILGEDLAGKGYFPASFISDELPDIFAAADLIITRAGANSLAEIALLGKPSIIIPLQNSAGCHQRENAFEFQRSGASVVIEHENLTPNLFLTEIGKIIYNSELAKAMGENAKKLAYPGADEKIAELVLKVGSI